MQYTPYPEPMKLRFTATLWYWRGPAPFYFVTVPEVERGEITQVASAVTYGWGMVPAGVRIGKTEWTTSLWPKDGGYIVPIKQWVREAEHLDVNDSVNLELDISA